MEDELDMPNVELAEAEMLEEPVGLAIVDVGTLDEAIELAGLDEVLDVRLGDLLDVTDTLVILAEGEALALRIVDVVLAGKRQEHAEEMLVGA